MCISMQNSSVGGQPPIVPNMAGYFNSNKNSNVAEQFDSNQQQYRHHRDGNPKHMFGAVNHNQRPILSSPPAAQPNANDARKNTYSHITVQHNYHDHANDPSSMYAVEHPVRGGVTTPFPLKLHEMLEQVEQQDLEHIVSWQPHGRCFVVHKPKEFVKLLPNYFKLSKLPSFQRQLNLYGFERITKGADKSAYYHELFLRGKPFMAHAIQRIKVKGTGVRARSNPAQEPNFHKMTWVGVDAPKADIGECGNSNNINGGDCNNNAASTIDPYFEINSNACGLPYLVPPPRVAQPATQAPPPAPISVSSLPLTDCGKAVFAFENYAFHDVQTPPQTAAASGMAPPSPMWQPIESTPCTVTSHHHHPHDDHDDDDISVTHEMADFLQDFDFSKDLAFDHPNANNNNQHVPDLDDDAVFGQLLETIIS